MDGVEVVIWLFSSNTGTISVSSSLLPEQSTDRDKDGDSDSLRLLQLSSILTSTAMSCSSIMEVDFSKENVAVVDDVVDTEISVFLQNSDELIVNREPQLARHFKSTLDQINIVSSITNSGALNDAATPNESTARGRYSSRNMPNNCVVSIDLF